MEQWDRLEPVSKPTLPCLASQPHRRQPCSTTTGSLSREDRLLPSSPNPAVSFWGSGNPRNANLGSGTRNSESLGPCLGLLAMVQVLNMPPCSTTPLTKAQHRTHIGSNCTTYMLTHMCTHIHAHACIYTMQCTLVHIDTPHTYIHTPHMYIHILSTHMNTKHTTHIFSNMATHAAMHTHITLCIHTCIHAPHSHMFRHTCRHTHALIRTCSHMPDVPYCSVDLTPPMHGSGHPHGELLYNYAYGSSVKSAE